MTPTLGGPPRRAAGLLLLALAAGGCGLADYEEQMAEAQARVERFDKENQALGEPLTLPTRPVEEKPAEPPAAPKPPGKAAPPPAPAPPGLSAPSASMTVGNFFLRPPKEIQSRPSTEPPVGGLLYHYPRVPSTGAGAAGFTDLYVAVADDPQDDFKAKVLGKFQADGTTQTRPRSVVAPGRADPLDFSVTEFGREEFVYLAHFYPAVRPKLALVFRLPKASRASADPVLELSLSTFGDGPEGARLRQAYNQRKAAGGGRK